MLNNDVICVSTVFLFVCSGKVNGFVFQVEFSKLQTQMHREEIVILYDARCVIHCRLAVGLRGVP